MDDALNDIIIDTLCTAPYFIARPITAVGEDFLSEYSANYNSHWISGVCFIRAYPVDLFVSFVRECGLFVEVVE